MATGTIKLTLDTESVQVMIDAIKALQARVDALEKNTTT